MKLQHLLPAALVPLMLLAPAPSSAQTVVPVQRFDNVELRGGGRVTLRNGPVQRVTLMKGSTQFTTFRVEGRGEDRLVIDACNRRCPRRYDLEIEIVTPHLEGVAISGGGEIVARGAFPQRASLAAAISGGGRIDLRAASTRSADAAIQGGGSIIVNARERLNAAVNGGGAVFYVGNPKISSAINGGGTVSRVR